jgi:L-fuconate dehydratase
MIRISSLRVLDVRFPTSQHLDGSEAMNADPDYSAAYVILETDWSGLDGHGLTVTIGRGNDTCCAAIEAMRHLIVGLDLEWIGEDMGRFWRHITSDSQLRCIGPDRGAIHLAIGAVVNAVWDLWAKAERKPVWRLVADMSPEELVRCIDFSDITDCITPEAALTMLRERAKGKSERLDDLMTNGYPCYQAIDWLEDLRFAKPSVIEEPTSPVDIEGHRRIREAMKGQMQVATGEMCQNRIVFKQLIMRGAIDVVQIDACRLGVNEVLAVMLMAAKYGLKVCPHAGGAGLCGYVQHLSMIDYLCIAGTKEGRVIEYVDHLHEHFVDPCVVRNAAYMPPSMPGYSIEMKQSSLERHLFRG